MAEQARKEAKRSAVSYRYDALNWEFVKLLAEIANYAGEKYGAPEQYTESRLVGQASPVNHMFEHLRAYLNGEPHDHFGTAKHQLAAVAYNAMMEFYYLEESGPTARNLFVVPCDPHSGSAFDDFWEEEERVPHSNLSEAVQMQFDFTTPVEPAPTTETAQEDPTSAKSKLLKFFQSIA